MVTKGFPLLYFWGFQDDQDSVLRRLPAQGRTGQNDLGAFCRGRGMSRAEDFAVEVVCEGVLRGWVGPEHGEKGGF